MEEAKILYAISIGVIIIWLYKLFAVYRKREKIIKKDDYKDILSSKKYKVKGKFET